ncbi:MAG TPA: FAD-binding protein [archaeon]|nr:FAD-binding protein [archaeon]
MHDVIIIGSGGAGLSAAIEAKKISDKVLIITKAGLGASNTALGQGGMQAVFSERDSVESHVQDTLNNGKTNDLKLVKLMCSKGNETIKWLEGLGMEFDKDEEGKYIAKKSPGSSFPRTISFKGVMIGPKLISILAGKVKEMKIEFKENSPVTGIKKNEFFEVKTEKEEFQCRALIIAGGGAGYKKGKESGILSSNHVTATGEATDFALKLGAQARDIDSFQLHPFGVSYPRQMQGKIISTTIIHYGVKLLNKNKERFVDENLDRESVCSAMFKEKEKNNFIEKDGAIGFYLDFSDVVKKHGIDLIKQRMSSYYNSAKAFGIDLAEEPLLVYPIMHYQNGGLKINEKAETNIEGLFACGECTGGVHGTNRMAGNSYLDILVFGRIAGKNAALAGQIRSPKRFGGDLHDLRFARSCS